MTLVTIAIVLGLVFGYTFSMWWPRRHTTARFAGLHLALLVQVGGITVVLLPLAVLQPPMFWAVLLAYLLATGLGRVCLKAGGGDLLNPIPTAPHQGHVETPTPQGVAHRADSIRVGDPSTDVARLHLLTVHNDAQEAFIAPDHLIGLVHRAKYPACTFGDLWNPERARQALIVLGIILDRVDTSEENQL